MEDRVESVGVIFQRMLERMPLKKEFKVRRAMLHWKDIVGDDIAAQSSPFCFERHTLWLGVRNSVWSHHLWMMRHRLVSALNAYIGEPLVEDIRFDSYREQQEFMLDGEEEMMPDVGAELKKIQIDAQDSEAIRNLVAKIQDSELKKRAARLYRGELTLRKYKKKKGFRPCRICGALCEDDLCTACSRRQREGQMAEVRRLLDALPWFTYAEINRDLPCSPRAYMDAKLSLQQLYADRLPKKMTANDFKENTDLIMLAMLYKGLRYDQLTGALLEETYNKFRRRF